jgi:hypothetical protein
MGICAVSKFSVEGYTSRRSQLIAHHENAAEHSPYGLPPEGRRARRGPGNSTGATRPNLVKAALSRPHQGAQATGIPQTGQAASRCETS